MASADVTPPPWGPGFLRLNSVIYRAEYGAATLALLAIVFGWRWLALHELSEVEALLFLFWWALPDLVAFVPIGVSSRGSRSWPRWGPSLYNLFHNLLVWGVVFALWSLLTGQVVWPLLGWATHVTMDRAAGYYLRAPVTSDRS